MLFMVWSDEGASIKAYCVPDSFTSTSNLKVFSGGQHLTTLPPNAFNEHMKGRHETGQVGFEITDQQIPGLAGLADLELRDEETDLLIYRRAPSDPMISQAVFRLETRLMPLQSFDRALKNRFRFWYDRIDMYSAETARQVLAFHTFGSLYTSGRILYGNYDYYVYEHQKCLILMQDPFDELAERLLIFNRLSPEELARVLSDRDILYFEPMVRLAKEFKSFDEKEIRRVLRNADPDALAVLSNPVSRQLTAKTPDELADSNTFPKALRALSEFTVVGLRSGYDEFKAAVAETLEISPDVFGPTTHNPDVMQLAAKLREQSWLDGLIEHDLHLYASIESAIASVR